MGAPLPSYRPPVEETSPPRRYPYGRVAFFTAFGSLLLCYLLLVVQPAISVFFPPSEEPVQDTPMLVAVTGSVAFHVESTFLELVHSSAAGFCQEHTLRVEETATQILLTAYVATRHLPYCEDLTRDPLPYPATVALNTPVGERPIVDALTGRTVPWFDVRDALRLPPTTEGWHSTRSLGEVATFAADFGGADAATYAVTYYGSGEDKAPSPRDRLWIVNSKGGVWTPPAGTAITPVTVRGRSGRAAAGIVVWEEGDATMAVRWDTENRPRPTTEQLVAIAATLTHGEGP